MKKYILLFLSVSLSSVSYSQVIKGVVLDKQTHDTVTFASVYFSGTFTGTYTDSRGYFELKPAGKLNMPVTISAIGYYSETLATYSLDKLIKVYISPKVYELNEIVVSDKSLARDRKSNMAIFKNEFLGRTTNAAMCEIINENDISFNYGSYNDTLKAFASKPVIIENRGLGYKIIYYLDRFEYYRATSSFMFRGSIIFAEDYAADTAKSESYEKKRHNAYLGSRMHFFRALWANELNSTGFVIQNSLGEVLGYDNIVYQDGGKKYLRYRGNLRIFYYSNKVSSTLEFLGQKVYFDSSGYYDASGIMWQGPMSNQRIGDWLPFEYTFRYF
jgi:hypothetical protein